MQPGRQQQQRLAAVRWALQGLGGGPHSCAVSRVLSDVGDVKHLLVSHHPSQDALSRTQLLELFDGVQPGSSSNQLVLVCSTAYAVGRRSRIHKTLPACPVSGCSWQGTHGSHNPCSTRAFQ